MPKFELYKPHMYAANVMLEYINCPFYRDSVKPFRHACFSQLRSRYGGWVVVYWQWHEAADIRAQQKKYISGLIKATDDPNHLIFPQDLGVWVVVDCENSKVSANYTYTFLSFSRIPFEGVLEIKHFRGIHSTLYNMIRFESGMLFNENHRIFSHLEKENLWKYRKCKKLSDLFGWPGSPVSKPISVGGYKSPTGMYVGIEDASWW
jgi:hypothetical protein